MSIRGRSITLACLAVIMVHCMSAQWVQTNGPTGAAVTCFTSTDAHLFIGTEGGGIFRSARSPIDWSPANVGLTAGMPILSMAVHNGTLFAGTPDGLFRSSDEGMHWTELGDFSDVEALHVSHTDPGGAAMLVAAQSGALHFSSDDGDTWRRGRSGAYTAIASNDSSIYAGGSTGLWSSTDNGVTWQTALSPGTLNGTVRAIAADGSSIVVGTSYGGVTRSLDKGATWKNIGLTLYNGLSIVVKGIAIAPDATADNGIVVIAATTRGVFTSSGAETMWLPRNGGLLSTYTTSPLIDGNDVYIGASGAGVYRGGVYYNGSW